MCWNKQLRQLPQRAKAHKSSWACQHRTENGISYCRKTSPQTPPPPLAKGRQSGKRRRQLNKVEALRWQKHRGLVRYLLIILIDTKHDLGWAFQFTTSFPQHGSKFHPIQTVECVLVCRVLPSTVCVKVEILNGDLYKVRNSYAYSAGPCVICKKLVGKRNLRVFSELGTGVRTSETRSYAQSREISYLTARSFAP